MNWSMVGRVLFSSPFLYSPGSSAQRIASPTHGGSSRLTQTRKFLAGIPAGQLDLTSASVRLSPLGDSVLR